MTVLWSSLSRAFWFLPPLTSLAWPPPRFVNGAGYFAAVADAILRAREEIFITDWWWVGKDHERRGRVGSVADQRTGEGRVGWSLACLLPAALNSRLSPEIYLKRPAHSDDWRLDIMLKRKAVRRVVRLERRHGGVACGWRLIGRTATREKVENLRLQGREMCPS